MKKMFLATLAALGGGMLSSSTYAQLDLGGAVSGAINQATGGGQAGVQAGSQAGTQAGTQAGSTLSGQAGTLGSGTFGTGSLGTQAGGQLGAQGALGGQPGSTGFGTGLGAGINSAANAAGINTGIGANTAVQTGAGQGWLGPIGNDLRSAFQAGDNRLQTNLPQSLQQYGFRPGDQIIDPSGRPLQAGQFDQYLQSNPNQVRVLRNGQVVTLGSGQAYGAQGQVYGQPFGAGAPGYAPGTIHSAVQGGMVQGGMMPGARPRLGIFMNPSADAVVVANVAPGSPAQMAGIRPGDQIISVNGRPVANPQAMIQAVGQVGADQSLALQYRRNGQVMESQLMLAGSGVGQYRAGYGGPAEIQARIQQLEQELNQLRMNLRQMQGDAGSAGGAGATGEAGIDDGAAAGGIRGGASGLGAADVGAAGAGFGAGSGDSGIGAAARGGVSGSTELNRGAGDRTNAGDFGADAAGDADASIGGDAGQGTRAGAAGGARGSAGASGAGTGGAGAGTGGAGAGTGGAGAGAGGGAGGAGAGGGAGGGGL